MRTTRRSTPRPFCTEGNIKPPYRLTVGLLALFLIAGCGKSPSKPADEPGKDPAKTEEGPRRIIESGAITLNANNPDGTAAWVVKGESARAGLKEGGDNEFYITRATGEIYEAGEVVSTFTANSAKAATESKKLVLDGNVKITSLAKKPAPNTQLNSQIAGNELNLKADKITWMEDKKLFAASGNVQIDSPDYQLGYMEEVWATRDLSKIGTPSKFK